MWTAPVGTAQATLHLWAVVDSMIAWYLRNMGPYRRGPAETQAAGYSRIRDRRTSLSTLKLAFVKGYPSCSNPTEACAHATPETMRGTALHGTYHKKASLERVFRRPRSS